MAKIYGNTVTTPMPVADWNQTDENKADYIKNKPIVLTEDDVANIIKNSGGGGSVTPEQIQEAVNEYFQEHPISETKETYRVGIYRDVKGWHVASGSFEEIEEAFSNGKTVILTATHNRALHTEALATSIGTNFNIITFTPLRTDIAGAGVVAQNFLWFENDTVEAIEFEFAEKASTLAGYGIEDAYTKDEVNNLIGDIDSALDELHNYAQALIGGAS